VSSTLNKRMQSANPASVEVGVDVVPASQPAGHGPLVSSGGHFLPALSVPDAQDAARAEPSDANATSATSKKAVVRESPMI
jgi:hypothetical protein